MEAVGFVKTVLDTWDSIQTKREDHKDSKTLAKELKLFGLSNRREDLKDDLKLAQGIMKDRSTSKEQRDQLASRFQRLNDILETIPKVADEVIESTSRKSHLFHRTPEIKVLKGKIAAFSAASSEFHQKLMTLNAITNQESALFLTSQDLTIVGSTPELTRVSEMAYTAEASYVEPGKPDKVSIHVLVEQMPYTDQSKTETDKNMRVLATKLSSSQSNGNIPRLIGYRDSNGNEKLNMELVFESPQPFKELSSLANLYASDTPEPTLNLRLKLCRQIAEAVLQTHTLRLVHKHVRPENLVVSFQKDEDGEIDGASIFLSGWTNARLIEGIATKRIGESAVSRIIYQHPKRRLKGGSAQEDYNIGHDIYSLGVCMLELLTWDVLIRPGETVAAAPILSESYRRAFERLGYHEALDLPSDDDSEDEVSLAELYTRDSTEIQNALVEMAKKLVPKKAGTRIANLVHRCLTCLDAPAGTEDSALSGGLGSNLVVETFEAELLDDLNKLLAVI